MAHDNTNQMTGFMTKGSDCIGEMIGAGIREWGTGMEDQVSLTQGHLLFGAVAAEKEEAAATDGIGAGAERFEAVEIPLKRTNQSQKARQRVLVWVVMGVSLLSV